MAFWRGHRYSTYEEEEYDTDSENEYDTSSDESYESENEEFTDDETGNFVYRLLNEDEIDESALFPKNRYSNESIENHVRIGSSPGFESKYISTCRNYSDVRDFLSLKCKGDVDHVEIARIDLDQLDERKVIDLTIIDNRFRYLLSERAHYLAEKWNEVLIKGRIPESAYEIIYSGSKDWCPYEEPD